MDGVFQHLHHAQQRVVGVIYTGQAVRVRTHIHTWIDLDTYTVRHVYTSDGVNVFFMAFINHCITFETTFIL